MVWASPQQTTTAAHETRPQQLPKAGRSSNEKISRTPCAFLHRFAKPTPEPDKPAESDDDDTCYHIDWYSNTTQQEDREGEQHTRLARDWCDTVSTALDGPAVVVLAITGPATPGPH